MDGMPLSFNLSLLLYGWFVLFVLQLAVGPALVKWLPRCADRGWAFGRLVGWLLVSLVVWNLGHLNLPINQQSGIWLVFLGLVVALGLYNFSHRASFKKWFRNFWPIILLEEFLFLVGFLGFGLIRSFNPEMMGLEKFMDGGFIASYLRSPVLPMEDMWLAGFGVNYYTFGHFMGSILTRFWAIDLSYSYNLLLAMIFGLTLSGSFSLILNLAHYNARKLLLPGVFGGLVGAVLLTLGGNSHTLWYLLVNRTMIGYLYSDATRFIEFTIHEFPSYSFVVSDLHAHVWDLPIVLFFLLLCLSWYRSMGQDATSHRLTAALGGLLGVMAMTNTWDVLIYGVLMAVLFFLLLVFQRVRLSRLIFACLLLIGSMAVLAYFWWVNFDSISEGVRLVQTRSPLWQLIVLWGAHIFLGILALVLALRFRRKGGLVSPLIVALVLVAFIFLILPEIIYFKDIYPSHPRANTMFKLTYQSFIILSLVTGWLLSRVWSLKKTKLWLRLPMAALVTLLSGSFLLFTYPAFQTYYGRFSQMKFLDGLAWLQEQSPDDYAAIIWLGENVQGRPVILEAVGESYTTFARVSANTGLPTVLGWRVHEWLWRNGFEIPGTRTEQVKLVYQQPTSPAAKALLAEYKVKYVILGSKEREAYLEDEEGLKSLGTVVFEQGETKIIAL